MEAEFKLVKCPRCGCEPTFTRTPANWTRVRCSGCRAVASCRKSAHDAIAVWNRRAEWESKRPAARGDAARRKS